MDSILDIIFPKSCSICKKKGEYLCSRCKKLFKKSIPECYICRRLSNGYITHATCKHDASLDSVYIGWEYNSLTSDLLKKYKYGYAYDISPTLSDFFVNTLRSSVYSKSITKSLITNVPISTNRLNERGFNQTFDVSKRIAGMYNLDFDNTLIMRKSTSEHQSLKDKNEREVISKNDFLLLNKVDVSKYKSITIVDDVLTTGATLEAIANLLRDYYGQRLEVNAVCMFRGKPYYSSSELEVSSTTSSSPSGVS